MALKPTLWRNTFVVPKFKAGFALSSASWRFLEIRAQIALLHEAVLIARLRPRHRAAVLPGQSGYVRDVGDAHLALHEITAMRRDVGLPTLPAFGDVARAFPRTWRADFLHETATAAGVTDGALATLGDIMASDVATITLQGFSKLLKTEGVPEGGVIGPAGFNTWLNSLATLLRDEDHGVGVCCAVPEAWTGITWSSNGAPDMLQVATCHCNKARGAAPGQSKH